MMKSQAIFQDIKNIVSMKKFKSLTIILLIILFIFIAVSCKNDSEGEEVSGNKSGTITREEKENEFMNLFERDIEINGLKLLLSIENKPQMNEDDYQYSKDDLYYTIIQFTENNNSSKYEVIDSYEGIIIKDMYEDVFINLKNTEEITFPKNINYKRFSKISNSTSIKKVVFPDTLESISSYSFSGCENLEAIQIPKNVKIIEEFAFYNCVSLKKVEFNNLLEDIGNKAFYNNISLESIIFPSSLQRIGTETFAMCIGLKNVDFNNSTSTLLNNSFYCCFELNTILNYENITNIGEKAFYSTKISNFTIHENLEKIGNDVFWGGNLESIVINNNNYSNSNNEYLWLIPLSYPRIIYIVEKLSIGGIITNNYKEDASDLSGHKKFILSIYN